MPLRSEDLSILKTCYELMRKIEETAKDGDFQKEELQKLSQLLGSLARSDQPEVKKLAQIPAHLNSQMSLRHFLNFLVPLERLLGRQLSDDSFLITSTDRPQATNPKVPLYFVLENIRSAFNVGSIFRLADCLAVQKIYLCGYTPTPDQDNLKKTSLGTTGNTDWVNKIFLTEALEELKHLRISLIGLETAKSATSLFEYKPKGPTAFIVGNERFGLEAAALAKCDEILTIPTFGMKNSLNVSNALSIASYEWRRQWS